jgi:hypothetical protein
MSVTATANYRPIQWNGWGTLSGPVKLRRRIIDGQMRVFSA